MSASYGIEGIFITYCSKCGAEVGDSSAFCPNCGAPTGGSGYNGQTHRGPIYNAVPQKSTGITIVLAFLFPGLGHLYAGKITRGILIIALNVIISAISLVIVLAAGVLNYDYPYGYDDWLARYLLYVGAVSIISFVIWVWNIYDANKIVNEYNTHVRNTGNPPW